MLPIQWKLTYTSRQKCFHDLEAKATVPRDFKVFIYGGCVRKLQDKIYSNLAASPASPCSLHIDYYDEKACALDSSLGQVLEFAAPFTGALLIIGGFLCCFFGSILIAWAVALLLAVAGSLGIFLIVYNFIPYDVPRAVLTLLLLGSLGAGVVVGRFGYKWSKSHSIYVPIIGGWGGLVLATLLLGLLFPQANQIASLAAAVIGALLGGLLANHFKAKLKWMGTAAIGSYILIRGLQLVV